MNLQKVSTKKLQSMLATASEELAAEINAILVERGIGQTSSEEDQISSEEGLEATDEDAEFLKSLEDQDKPAKPAKTSSNKLTYEEAQAQAKELETNIGHKCRVVPFNSIEWTEGYIAGVVADKRSCKVLYAIVLNDGKRIVKAFDAKFLEIMEEKVETTRRARKTSSAEKLDDEKLMELAAELSGFIGHHVEYEPTKEIYILVEGQPKLQEKLTGILKAIVPDKRSGRCLLRIENELVVWDFKNQIEKTERLVTHKVSVADDVKILDTFDEEAKNSYIARKENRLALSNLTPADAFKKATEAHAKALNMLKKAQELLEARQKDLEEAQAKYEAWAAENPDFAAAEQPEDLA